MIWIQVPYNFYLTTEALIKSLSLNILANENYNKTCF